MGFIDQSCLILIILIALTCLRAQAKNLVTTCDQKDLKALQDFMVELQHPPESWQTNSSSPINGCDWEGVTCEPMGRVVKLELSKKKLHGRLSGSLGSLDKLRTLNLSNNFLRSSLPISLFNLSSLQVLDLSFNDFTGPVPDLDKLSSIQLLDMSQNRLNGSLPSHICSGASSVLKVVSLTANYFSGEIPSGFGDCYSLEHLSLGLNDLNDVSERLFRLRKLSHLFLAENMLAGKLSRAIGNLTSLVFLDISSNGFSGPIPDIFQNLRNIQHFIAHSNRFDGNIPVSLSNSQSLSTLNLRNNSMEGTINLNCSAMVSLISLDLATNLFEGHIPDNLPSCRHLKNVNLARNNLIGEIPESFKDFHSLSYLALTNTANTNLSSALRVLHRCENLANLVLSLTFRDDQFPLDPELHFPKLKIFVVANSRLIGSVPPWLSKSDRLQLSDLSFNRLAGTIPGWLGGFESLFYLDLSNNSFVGEIPKNLTRLSSLIDRDILIEEPSPDFAIFKKSNLSARGLQYNQFWSFPPTLDLSYNNLIGPIWPEFGNLRKLHVLNLKFNNLSGPIPSTLSEMSNMENLDLSHNNLSGTIPSSLTRLTFLSRFNVAFNKLIGSVPMGSQFSTFPNSSFEGNDLCGIQTEKPCGPSEKVPKETESSRELKTGRVFVDAIEVGMGVGTAFGLVFGVVLFQVLTRKYGMFRFKTKPTRKHIYVFNFLGM